MQQVPDIGDFADVPVIEIHVGRGRHGRRGGPAGHARVRQGDDGRARARGRARSSELLVSVDDKVSEGTPILTLETARMARTAQAPEPSDRGSAAAEDAEDAPAAEDADEKAPNAEPPAEPEPGCRRTAAGRAGASS